MRKLLFVSLLAASSAWAQGPAPFFAVDFTKVGQLPSYLATKYPPPQYGDLVPGTGWVFDLPSGQNFDTWGGANNDKCARVYFEAGLTDSFAVQAHLTDSTYSSGEASSGIIIYWAADNMVFFAAHQNKVRIEGPNGTYGGGTDALTSGGPWRNIYLRVEVVGPYYRFLYSFDGVSWVLAATRSCPLPPAEIGIFCKTWSSNPPAMSTTFADFIYEPYTPPGAPPTQNATWVGPADGVTLGLFSEGSNWNTGVVPGDSNEAVFTGNNVDYLVTFPPAGRRAPNRIFTGGIGEGTVTFDTRGTHWILGTSHYGQNILNLGHSFELANSSNPLFMLSNAVFRVWRSPTISSNILETGWFNMANPDPAAPSAMGVYLGYSNAHTNVLLFKEGSSSRVQWYQFRAKGPKNLIRYEGGDHEVLGDFIVKNECDANNPAELMPAEVEIAGSAVLRTYKNLNAGNVGKGAQGIVTVDAGGTWEHRGGELNFGNADGSVGILNITGGTVVNSSGGVFLGRGQGRTGIMNLTGGTYEHRNGAGFFRAPDGQGCTGIINIDGGLFHFTAVNMQMNLGDNDNNCTGMGTMNIRGGTYWQDAGGFCVGAYGSQGRLNIDSGLFRFRGSIVVSIGGGRWGKGILEMTGGAYIQDTMDLIVGSGSGIAQDTSGKGEGSWGEIIMRGGTFQQNGGTLYLGTTGGSDQGWGLLRLYGGTLRAAIITGGAGRSLTTPSGLFADGGTLQLRMAVDPFVGSVVNVPATLLGNLDVAELTDKGLTIDTASGLAYVRQAFTDAVGSEGLGLLTVTGGGTIIFDADSAHGWTVVDDAVVQIALDAVPGLNVAVINGGVLSLAGDCTGVALDSLVLGDSQSTGGVLLDAGDVIYVSDAMQFECFDGAVYFTDAELPGPTTVFTVQGSLSSTAIASLRVGNPAAGFAYTFGVVPNGNDTDVVVTPSAQAAGIWTGPDNGLWATQGNWLHNAPPAVPDVAVFDDTNGSGGNVTVPSGGAEVRNILLDSLTPYQLAGTGTLQVNAGIDVKAGGHQVDAPLSLAARGLTIAVLPGTALRLNGDITGPGGVRATGAGAAVALTGTNTFAGGLTVAGGTVVVTGSAAFGATTPDPASLVLRSGTLLYSGDDTPVASGLLISTPEKHQSVVINTFTDLTLSNGLYTAQQGALIKRGSADLTFHVPDGSHTLIVDDGPQVPGDGYNDHPAKVRLDFAVTGDSPVEGYKGFTVAEGKVRFVGSKDATVNIPTTTMVGVNTAQGTAVPTLEVDGCRLNMGRAGRRNYFATSYKTQNDMQHAAVVLTNGAVCVFESFSMGWDNDIQTELQLTMDGSALYTLWYMHNIPRIGFRASVANRSYIEHRRESMQMNGPFDITIDDSTVFFNSDWGGPFFRDQGQGSFRFVNNARLRTYRLRFHNNWWSPSDVHVLFDNATLEFLRTDATRIENDNHERFIWEIGGGGMTVDTGIDYLEANRGGVTHTLTVPITGGGALTKVGCGTLVLGPTSYNDRKDLWGVPVVQYTGGTFVKEGTLTATVGAFTNTAAVAVSEGATLNLGNDLVSPVEFGTLSGAGTVTNGVLGAKYLYIPGQLLTFADVVTPPGFTVTFDTRQGPLSGRFPVAKFTGAAPAIENWKGDKVTAVFSSEGDTIYAAIQFSTLIILR